MLPAIDLLVFPCCCIHWAAIRCSKYAKLEGNHYKLVNISFVIMTNLSVPFLAIMKFSLANPPKGTRSDPVVNTKNLRFKSSSNSCKISQKDLYRVSTALKRHRGLTLLWTSPLYIRHNERFALILGNPTSVNRRSTPLAPQDEITSN